MSLSSLDVRLSYDASQARRVLNSAQRKLLAMTAQKRPRRSHQCTGKRARNYVRALARVNNRARVINVPARHGMSRGGAPYTMHAHKASPSTVLADARASGALAAHRRREKQRDKWAEGRKHV